jgi:hypothetical protein
MTPLPDLSRGRTAMDVPWDRARERRVLDRALQSWRRRARRMRALEFSGVALMIVLLGRVALRTSAGSSDGEPAVAVPGAQLEPSSAPDAVIKPPIDKATRPKSTASGGFAGTGGHGGTGSTGLGGNAGTG